jgi:hypothetical protein
MEWNLGSEEKGKKKAKISYVIFQAIARSNLPVTVAARTKEWTVVARSDAEILGSNPT